MTAVVVDTGVFSAGLSRRRNDLVAAYAEHLQGRVLVIAPQTVAEMRFGALAARWGAGRIAELERRVALARIAVIDDALIWTHARLRVDCRAAGHALAQPTHAADLWVAATAVHLGIPLVSHDQVFARTPGLDLVSADRR